MVPSGRLVKTSIIVRGGVCMVPVSGIAGLLLLQVIPSALLIKKQDCRNLQNNENVL
jgi:hypothetical protein